MDILALAVSATVAVCFLLIVLAARRVLLSGTLPITLTVERPMKARVMVECPLCRGGGREPLRVDPREHPAIMDKHLQTEDFPVCSECKGIGYKERYLLDLSRGSWTLTAQAFTGGLQSPPTSMSPSEPPGDSPPAGSSPSAASKSDAA